MTQRMIHISSPLFLREPEAARGLTSCFDRPQQPLCLEIGCGTGDFLIESARRQPNCNFLGIDIFNKGCNKTCNKAMKAGLVNIRVMRCEARLLLHRFVAAGSLQRVYINCPDPWPKKRHRERRLVNRDFLDLLAYTLAPGGELYFVTDFDNYAEQVGELIPTLEAFSNLRQTPVSTSLGDYPVSKYMRRFLDLGQPLYLSHLQRRADVSVAAPTPPEEMQRGFRLQWLRPEHD